MRNGIVVMIVILLLTASGLAGYYAGIGNARASTVTVTTTKLLSDTVNYTLGISLGLSGNSSIPIGNNETIIVSLTNESPSPNNATYTVLPVLRYGPSFQGYGWEDFVLPFPPSCGNTPNGYIPYFVVIYNQSHVPLQLNALPFAELVCPAQKPMFGHLFGSSQVIKETFTFGGFWKSPNKNEPWLNATFMRFNPGTYTVIAVDPWNQVVEMKFMVIG